MNTQRCIVVTKSITEEDTVRKRLSNLKVIEGSYQPAGSRIQKTVFFRTELSVEDKQFLSARNITHFGDEESTVGLV